MSDEEIQARAIATLSGIRINVRKVGHAPYKVGTYGIAISLYPTAAIYPYSRTYNWADALKSVKQFAAILAQTTA